MVQHPSERNRRAVLKGALSVLGGDVGRLLTFAVFIPLLVRVVGESNFGYYALVMAVFLPLRKLLNLGLFEASKTYVTRAESDSERTLTAASFLLHALALVVGLPVLAVVFLVLPVESVLTGSLLWLLPALAGEQLYNFGRGVLHSRGRESVVEPLIPVRSVILAVVGLTLADAGYGVPGVFAGFATGFLTAGILATGLAIREVGVPAGAFRTVDRETLARLVRFGSPSMVMAISIIGLYKVDVLLVGFFLTPTDTGHYRAALQVSEFIWVVPLAGQMMMIQTTTTLWRDGALDEITRQLSEALNYVVVVTALLVAGVFVLNDEFLRLYFGPGFVASERPLEVLLPGVLFFSVARVIWPVMQSGGHLRGLLAVIGSALATNVVLNAALIPRLGIVGAAIATSGSYALMAVLQVWFARTRGVDPLDGLPVGRIALVTTATLGVIAVVDTRLGPLLSLAVVPVCGLVVYAALSFLAGIVTVDEVRGLIASVRDRGTST